MLSKLKISTDNLLILFVVFLAAILRFYNFWDLPFMHDEFSAILRANYDSFSDLIEIGVKQNDSHPAGVQVFIYYWIKLFGLSEASLKFPFILMGTLSVYVIYLIGKQWFGKNTAILSALVLSVLQFGIFYSQLARPYSPGLLFVLLSTFFWTKLVFDKQSKVITIIAYVLFASLASYVHAFSLFFVLVQGISGILFVRGKSLRNYVLINTIIFLLYLPHISIFLAQIGRGDIGGWLGEPDKLFLVYFIKYAFHYSWFFLSFIISIIVLFAILYPNKKSGINKFRLLSICWFLISYATAHIYSVYRSPILQYSTLLFVFPFLLLFVFSFIGKLKKIHKYLMLFFIVVTGVSTLIVNRQHYKIMYVQGFDGIPLEISRDKKLHQQTDVATIMQAPEHRMFDYYFEKNKLSNDYFQIDKKQTIKEINDYLIKGETTSLFYGWADYASLEYLEFFKDKYKYLLNEKQFFNSEYYFFTNKSFGDNTDLSVKSRNLIKKIPKGDKLFLYKNSRPGYSKSIDIKLDSLSLDKFDVINVRAKVNYSDIDVDALLVFDLKDTTDKVLFWSASNFNKYFINEDSSGYYVYHSKRVMSIYPLSEGSILKTYIWQRDSSLLEVSNIEVYLTKLSPIEMGLYEEIP